MSNSTPVLTPADKAHFLQHGFVKIPQCFTPSAAASFTSTLWPRLGMSPTDKSTWTAERINMPWHTHVPVQEFAPKAWAAMCELLGGEERIKTESSGWSDGFIVNLGTDEYEGKENEELDLRGLRGWHNDGDFFVHYLDSPEQALLVIPLWSSIQSKGGGTAICGDGIKYIAQHLYDHPEGVTPWMVSLSDPSHTSYEGGTFWASLARDRTKLPHESSFVEATGDVGDVFLLHPLMLHSASKNLLRIPRVITNPPVALREPFRLWREDGAYSLVEQKTLRDLGKPGGLEGWEVKGERKGWVSKRMRGLAEARGRERERLRKVEEEEGGKKELAES